MGEKSSAKHDTTSDNTYIGFLMNLKRQEIEELQEEIGQLETKKQEYTQLYGELKREEEGHIKNLWKHFKGQEVKLEQTEEFSREQVLEHNLDMLCSEQAEIAELQSKLSHVERQVIDLEMECHVLLQYKNNGSQEHRAQIAQMEEELENMQRKYEDEAGHIKQSMQVAFSKIDQETARLTDEKKQPATETAFRHLDKFSQEKITENQWLQREIAIHSKEVSTLEQSVQSLEEENLEHIKWLHEQHIVDVVIRNAFLTRTDESGTCQSEMDKKSLTSDQDVGNGTRWLDVDETDLTFGSEHKLHLGAVEQRRLFVVGHSVPLHPVSSEDDCQDCQGPEDGCLTTQIINKGFK